MQLIPAIDLLDGRCVRLLHGDFNACETYDVDPIEWAETYRGEGAEWLHLVDLAASRDGAGADTGPLFGFLRRAPISVQTGGGVRSGGDVRERLDRGAARVVVGSLCVTETGRFEGWLDRFGREALVAALDVRIGSDGLPRPRIHGWTEGTDVILWDLLERLCTAGLKHALVTDISRDGALSGPNVSLYGEIVQRFPGLRLQASGGVGTLADLGALAGTGAAAAIVGKALLERRFTVAEALEVLA